MVVDPDRTSPPPGVWWGEVCTTGLSGTVSLHPVSRPLVGCGGVNDSAPPGLASREALSAAPRWGPYELLIRLMGAEVVVAPPVHDGACNYSATFLVGTPGRYNLQITLWRSAWGALQEKRGMWSSWQADHLFGLDVWVQLGEDATISPGATPLSTWDAGASNLPVCGQGDTSPPADVPGRWVVNTTAYSGPPVFGQDGGLRWSVDWESGMEWRRFSCRDLPPTAAPTSLELLRGKSVLVTGDSQARNAFNSMLKHLQPLHLGEQVKGKDGCRDVSPVLGVGASWCYKKDDFGKAFAYPRKGRSGGAAVLVFSVGGWPLAGAHWTLGRWTPYARKIARSLVRYATTSGGVVLWLGNPAYPFRRSANVRQYGDMRTTQRLTELDAISAAAMAAALVGQPAEIKRRVMMLPTSAAAGTAALVDAMRDNAHPAQPPAQRFLAQVVLEGLRATSPQMALGRGGGDG